MGLECSLLEGKFEMVARRNQRGICQACEESDAKNKELMGEQCRKHGDNSVIWRHYMEVP